MRGDRPVAGAHGQEELPPAGERQSGEGQIGAFRRGPPGPAEPPHRRRRFAGPQAVAESGWQRVWERKGSCGAPSSDDADLGPEAGEIRADQDPLTWEAKKVGGLPPTTLFFPRIRRHIANMARTSKSKTPSTGFEKLRNPTSRGRHERIRRRVVKQQLEAEAESGAMESRREVASKAGATASRWRSPRRSRGRRREEEDTISASKSARGTSMGGSTDPKDRAGRRAEPGGRHDGGSGERLGARPRRGDRDGGCAGQADRIRQSAVQGRQALDAAPARPAPTSRRAAFR